MTKNFLSCADLFRGMSQTSGHRNPVRINPNPSLLRHFFSLDRDPFLAKIVQSEQGDVVRLPKREKEPLSIKRSQVGFGYAAEVRVYPYQGSDIPDVI